MKTKQRTARRRSSLEPRPYGRSGEYGKKTKKKTRGSSSWKSSETRSQGRRSEGRPENDGHPRRRRAAPDNGPRGSTKRSFKRGASAAGDRSSKSNARSTVRPNDKPINPKDVPIRAKSGKGAWKESAYRSTVATTVPVITTAAPTGPEAFGAKAGAVPGVGEPKERLQKVLAHCGIASRRKAELLILEGAVTVNGRIVTELGTKVDAKHDKIKVNGKLIYTEVEPIYLAFYKPKGVISALSDPEGRQHLGSFLYDIRERVLPIGRMDYNSEGLLLMTNDGALSEKIFKARGLPRVYMVKIKGHPTERDLEFLKRGIFTAQGVVRVAAMEVEQALRNKSWLKLEVTEGAQLDLREVLNHRGLLVDRIVRTAIGGISIKDLQPGQYRFLKRQDFERLINSPTTT
jgi:23S rRNA pseudouridine2605 synthase